MTFSVRVTLIFLALCALAMARETYQLVQNPAQFELPPLHTFSNLTTADHKLEQKELETTLDYMVWPAERSQLQAQYVRLLKEQLVANPTSSITWSKLLDVQYQQGASSSDQLWSFAHYFELRDWDRHSQRPLVFYCVRLQAVMSTGLAAQCDDLLRSVDWRNDLAWQARTMRLNADELADRLRLAGAL